MLNLNIIEEDFVLKSINQDTKLSLLLISALNKMFSITYKNVINYEIKTAGDNIY